MSAGVELLRRVTRRSDVTNQRISHAVSHDIQMPIVCGEHFGCCREVASRCASEKGIERHSAGAAPGA